MAYLEISTGDNVGRIFDLTDHVRIGRHADNEICLPHTSTSRYHARIFSDEMCFVLEDLNSSNGTELCGMRIPPNTPCKLTNGNVITIGQYRLCFYTAANAIDSARESPEPFKKSIAAQSTDIRNSSEASPHTRVFQLFEEGLASPIIIDKRDASIDLLQMISHQPHTSQEIRQIYRRLQAICQINATIGTSTDFHTMMTIFLDCLLEIYPKAERVFVLLSTPEHSELVPFAAQTRHQTSIQSEEPALSRTIVDTVKAQKCALLSHDVLEDPRFNTQESIITHGIRSLMCAPILVDDEFFGVVQLDSHSGMKAFTGDDLEVLTAIIAQVALAIKQVQLVIELKHEVAQRRESEAMLHESELYYRSLTEAAPVGVYRTERDGLYFYVNELWSTITGLTFTKAFGSGWTKALYPDDRERIFSKWTEAVQSGRPFQAEYRFQHQDGTIKWVYGQAVTEKTEDGTVSGYVGTITDITERKEADAEREQLQQQLIKFSRQAGIAEMATGVLHNVGNVLNSINVSVTLLDEQLKTSSVSSLAKANDLIQHHVNDLGHFITEDKNGKNFPIFLKQLTNKIQLDQKNWGDELNIMMHNIKHIKEIVDMQQSYSRISGVKEEVSLEILTEDALKAIDNSLLNHGIRLIKNFEPVPMLLTDKHKVLQIFVNLLSNARHALGDSEIAERRLTIRIFQPTANHATVEVADTGVGISEKNLKRIFEHGFTTKKDGHGFGLHSCGLMARELGGKLTVHSEGLGHGAIFRLELPLIEKGRFGSDTPSDI